MTADEGVFHGHGVTGEGEKRHVMFRDIWYPDNDIMAVINDPAEADRAIQALRSAGWHAEDVLVMRGTEVEERLDATGTHCHLIGHLLRSLWAVTNEEGRVFKEYQEQAKEGHSIVAVHTHEPKDIGLAQQILGQHHAHGMEYFGHGGFGIVRTLSAKESRETVP